MVTDFLRVDAGGRLEPYPGRGASLWGVGTMTLRHGGCLGVHEVPW